MNFICNLTRISCRSSWRIWTCCLTTEHKVYSVLDQFLNLHMRTYRNCYMLFPASFKLALMCCSCLHHLLPWVASCSLVLHYAFCASCLVYVWCVYHVVCFFSIVLVSLRSWGFVHLRLVRLRGFIFFMDLFFFLARFQARWPSPWISLLSFLC